MGVMCNNSFVIQIKTEGYTLTNEDIEKMLKKRFGRNTSFNVKEYVSPLPKMRVYPEKEKVYYNNCEHYNYLLGIDCYAGPAEYKDSWDRQYRITVDPSIKNKNNDCKDFESKHKKGKRR